MYLQLFLGYPRSGSDQKRVGPKFTGPFKKKAEAEIWRSRFQRHSDGNYTAVDTSIVDAIPDGQVSDFTPDRAPSDAHREMYELAL